MKWMAKVVTEVVEVDADFVGEDNLVVVFLRIGLFRCYRRRFLLCRKSIAVKYSPKEAPVSSK